MSIQTRNSDGKLEFYNTLKSAFEGYLRDPRVWKISYESHRFVVKRKDWFHPNLSETQLCEKSEKYKAAVSGEVFWINQSVLTSEVKEVYDSNEFKEFVKY